jgi:hypothetical protein
MFEDNFDITMQGPAHPLALRQLENTGSFFAHIPTLGHIGEQQFDFKTLTVVYFEERVDSLA